MKLNSAREAWFSAYYSPWDSVMSHALEIARLECAVQKTERGVTAGRAAHQALAGQVQRAIDTLPGYLRSFGHHMYNPLADDDQQDDAQEAVFVLGAKEIGPIRAKKYELARHVANGVLYRYRRMHQGGQSAGNDPSPTSESFRKFLFDEYGAEIRSENWGRDWEPLVNAFFNACNELDRQCLIPVANILYEMKSAA